MLFRSPQHIDLIRGWDLGPHRTDTGADTEWQYALVCDFDTVKDLRAYNADPFHVQLIPQLEHLIKDSAIADIELGQAIR